MTQYYPDLKILEISTRDFWDRLRRLFVKERNVTFDQYEAFTINKGNRKSRATPLHPDGTGCEKKIQMLTLQ